MIRVIVFLAFVGAVAFGFGWLADRPGTIVLAWQGWRIETSLVVALAGLMVLIAVVILIGAALRALINGPEAFMDFVRGRRRARGRRAIARGLVAIGVGDVRTARQAAAESGRYAPGDPLSLLLRAQTAQLTGDRAAAEAEFRAMLDRDETRALGFRGLFIEARRRGDPAMARHLAREATRHTPDVPWAGAALIEMHTGDGDWDGALATLERSRTSGTVDRATARRQRAVLLTAKARDVLETQPETALAAATEAVSLAPQLVPAAAIAGRLLAESGDLRRAARVLEQAWKTTPHPDLAEAYLHVRPGDAAQDRLKRARVLFDRARGAPEGALCLARAAIDARDFALARRTLAPLVEAGPTQRACVLMAELETAETGDRGRARGWLARTLTARRDPAWIADGVVSDRWQPLSPVTGRLDAFTWSVPHESLPPPGSALLEAAALESLAAPERTLEPAPAADIATPIVPGPAPDMVPPEGTDRTTLPIDTAAAESDRRDLPNPTPHPVVMPLPHAPDDPGPEPVLDAGADGGTATR